MEGNVVVARTAILHEKEFPILLFSNIGSSRPSRPLKHRFMASVKFIPSWPRTVKSIEGRGSQPFWKFSHWYVICSTMRRSGRVGKGVTEVAYKRIHNSFLVGSIATILTWDRACASRRCGLLRRVRLRSRPPSGLAARFLLIGYWILTLLVSTGGSSTDTGVVLSFPTMSTGLESEGSVRSHASVQRATVGVRSGCGWGFEEWSWFGSVLGRR
jgi:hypothetical protein